MTKSQAWLLSLERTLFVLRRFGHRSCSSADKGFDGHERYTGLAIPQTRFRPYGVDSMSNISELAKWLGARAETAEHLSAVDRQKMSEAAQALNRLADVDVCDSAAESRAAPASVESVGELASALAEAQMQAANALREREALAVKLFACRWLLRHYRKLQGSIKKINLAAVIADLEQAVEHGRTAVPVSEIEGQKALSECDRSSLLDEALRLLKHARELLQGAEIRHQARLGIISDEDARRFEEALLNPERVSPEELERARGVFDQIHLPMTQGRESAPGTTS